MLSLRGFAPVWFINCRVQFVMLVMLVKPADIFLDPIQCRVQSLAEYPAHWIASRSWTLQLLNTK